ncbi:hypothetical protein ACWEN6_13980 [Sphaerisporangium sp. NPDC004334]
MTIKTRMAVTSPAGAVEFWTATSPQPHRYRDITIHTPAPVAPPEAPDEFCGVWCRHLRGRCTTRSLNDTYPCTEEAVGHLAEFVKDGEGDADDIRTTWELLEHWHEMVFGAGQTTRVGHFGKTPEQSGLAVECLECHAQPGEQCEPTCSSHPDAPEGDEEATGVTDASGHVHSDVHLEMGAAW